MTKEENRKKGSYGPFFWGYRGNGIDIEPSCRLWGVNIGPRFFGMLYKDKPTASSSPVSGYMAYAKNRETKNKS